MIVAILTSDWHLSERPPLARSAEDNWAYAQSRPLLELKQLQRTYNCPIIVGGDVFDHWNAPASLINFALENLPENVWAVFGNHDLPLHSYAERKRSALWTLIAAERVKLISHKKPTVVDNVALHGFHHGFEPTPCQHQSGTFTLDIAVVHAYCWREGRGHPGALPEQQTSAYRERLTGYDVLHFGDNHSGFVTKGKPIIVNPGTLMRRRIDEQSYRPFVGLLSINGKVTKHYLDCSQDKFIDAELIKGAERDGIDAGDFVAGLEKLGRRSGFDHREAVIEYLRKRRIGKRTKRVVLEILEVANDGKPR